eukprot:3778569-Prymnesium_polylepis.1
MQLAALRGAERARSYSKSCSLSIKVKLKDGTRGRWLRTGCVADSRWSHGHVVGRSSSQSQC